MKRDHKGTEIVRDTKGLLEEEVRVGCTKRKEEEEGDESRIIG